MATDYWPQEEGYIVEGAPVMMCVATAAINEMATVFLGAATTIGQINVTAGAANGDSVGVALRSATTGQVVPIAFRGILKMQAGGVFALGCPVMNDGGAEPNSSSVITAGDSTAIILGTDGTERILGTALQQGVANDDELLILLGRW